MAAAPLVSVVVIFLDEERFLAEAIESVLAQTYPAWELILVDDGSTDGSAEIAKGYAERDSRIRCVTHPGGENRGMSASRNRGVADSGGELVAFLDGDDVWLPEKLVEQVELLERHPEVAMVYGRTQWWFSWDSASEVRQEEYLYDPAVPLDSIVEPPSLVAPLIRNDGNPPYTCSMLIRRSAYERLGGFEESFRGLFEDQAFFAKVFLEERVFVSRRCWDRYRQHDQSACAVGLRTGELHPLDLSPARQVFLEWLDRYIRSRSIGDEVLLRLLADELEPYRFPTAPSVVDWVDIPDRDPRLVGCSLDYPEPGTRTAGRRVHVLGWVIGEQAPVRAIELRSGELLLTTTPVDKPRPDLEAGFPGREEASKAGFRTSVSLTGMAPLHVSVVAVLEDGGRAEIGRFRATRRFRNNHAEVGLPMVSVVISATDGRGLSAALESLTAQTYPVFEVTVLAEDAAVEDAARAVPGVRVACRSAEEQHAFVLRATRGSLVLSISEGDRLPPDFLEAGVAALAAAPASGHAIGQLPDGGTLTLHQRFALAAGGSSKALPSTQFEVEGTLPHLRKPRTAGTLILMYHRVADAADPWGLAVSPTQFRDQLELLASEYEVVGLDRALQPATNRRRIAITFDDGYVDNLLAAEELAQRGLPATFFLVGGQLGSDREFWWDELERIMFGASQRASMIEVTIRGESVRVNLDAEGPIEDRHDWNASEEPRTARERLYLELYQRLNLLDHGERDAVMARLAEHVGQVRSARPELRALSHEETSLLAGIDGMEVGAHTLTHPRLSALDPMRQREEVAGSRHLLERITGRPVESFAYPHGTRDDYTSETVAIVADCGFRRACAAEGGVLRNTTSALELSRLMVEDWSSDEFERRLHDAFAKPSP
jgi:glycosyltransferase involved in cell wall biosynthesis/peptidoglycan/xylan/chitin deacetylase (PgdA/CDA1 family)